MKAVRLSVDPLPGQQGAQADSLQLSVDPLPGQQGEQADSLLLSVLLKKKKKKLFRCSTLSLHFVQRGESVSLALCRMK